MFALFCAREGQEEAIKAAMRKRVEIARQAPGCLEMRYFNAIEDPRLFLACSRWRDKTSVESFVHRPEIVVLTDRFMERLSHQLDVVPLRALDADGEGRTEGYWGDVGTNHHVFGRHHARAGLGDALAEALRDVVQNVRVRPGCVSAAVYQSVYEPDNFIVHVEWKDEVSSLAPIKEPRIIAVIEYLQSLEATQINVVRAHAVA